MRGNYGNFFFLVVFLALNILIFIPFLLFFFYTLVQIVPTLAVVIDPDTTKYAPVPLSDLYSDAPASHSQDPQSSFLSLGLGLRLMLSRLFSLRTRFKSLALFRGLWILLLVSIFENFIAGLSMRFLPPLLSVVPQILLPLLLVQLYTLWTHTVLTYPSKSIWQRILPFRTTLRATGPALAIFLAAKVLLRLTIVRVYWKSELRRQGDLYPPFLSVLVLAGAGVEAIAVAPAHMVLTRIQASLLAADEKTLVPIDEALRWDGRDEESEAVGMREAWRTFRWSAWKRMALLYVQVLAVVLIGGGVISTADFVFYIALAVLSM